MAALYAIRRYHAHDLSAVSTISALGNLNDALTKYMRRSPLSKWTSYRLSCVRFLKSLLLGAGTVCFVAESLATKEVVGWAIWSRHGKSERAKEWQRPNGGVMNWMERKLLSVETKYFEWVPGVDPTREDMHMKQLQPILAEEWPKEVFTEFWELDGICVHPDHYRKGIGRILALWGVERGKGEDVPVVVHGSPDGRKLYESVGFEVVARMVDFDAWVPEFKGMGPDGKGCWSMCWQPEGTNYLEKAREKMQKGKAKTEVKSVMGTPAESITLT
jgi:GNAT superfamily N-acetyltransferase